MAPQVPTETLCVQKVQCMYIICVYMCVFTKDLTKNRTQSGEENCSVSSMCTVQL